MRAGLLVALSILLLTSPAMGGERTLGPISTQPPVDVYEEAPIGIGRWLINDGSFEFGECNAGSAWTCTSNTSCSDIILNPMPVWDYPAYDGILCTWLGGFCGEEPRSNSVCQDTYIEGSCTGAFHSFKWMGYVVNEGGNFMRVTIDGEVVYQKEMMLSDHTYGTWNDAWFDTATYNGVHTICFEFEATTGANMLVDYILNAWGPTANQETNFSTIKTLY